MSSALALRAAVLTATATRPVPMVPATWVPVPLVAAVAPALVIAATAAVTLLGKQPTNARRLREGSCSSACPPARTGALPTVPMDHLQLWLRLLHLRPNFRVCTVWASVESLFFYGASVES